MKVLAWAAAAMVLYAFLNVFLEQKFSQYSTASLLFYTYTILLPMAAVRFAYEKMYAPEAVAPQGTAILLVMVLGFAYYFADYCYFSAFTSAKGDAVTVTTVVILVPVFVSVIKHVGMCWKPNMYHVISYGLAALSVLISIKANAK